MNAQTAILKVLQHEGGFVNHPNDPGGATNWGITQAVYEKFKGRKVTLEEMRKMPKSDAIAIYKQEYWDRVRGDSIRSYKVAFALFDQAINRGVSASVKQAQKVTGMIQDGIIGPATLNAINSMTEKEFLEKYLAESIAAYRAIVARRPASADFLEGWLNRVDSISDYVGVKPLTAAISGVVLIAGFFLIFFLSSKTKIA